MVFLLKNSIDFYDSVGRDISYYDHVFIDFIKRFALDLTSSCIRTQPINSFCGQYCLFYAYKNVKCIWYGHNNKRNEFKILCTFICKK